MKELITKALNEASELLDKQIPHTKKERRSISIEDVSPLELNRFMLDNNIPSNASFSVEGDSEAFFVTSYACLEWDIRIPVTEKDRLEFKRRRFERIAWKAVYNILIAAGYKRRGFNSGLLKGFKDTNLYSLFVNGEYDRLVDYYSLMFKLD